MIGVNWWLIFVFQNGAPPGCATLGARQKSKHYATGDTCQFSRFWKNLNQKSLSLLTNLQYDDKQNCFHGNRGSVYRKRTSIVVCNFGMCVENHYCCCFDISEPHFEHLLHLMQISHKMTFYKEINGFQ